MAAQKKPASPRDPNWWQDQPWWKVMGIVIANVFKSPGKRWWTHWMIAVFVFGSLLVPAMMYVLFAS